MKNNRKFWLAQGMFILGLGAIGAGIAKPSSLLIGGIYLVLGTLAYISTKKRKLGIIKNTYTIRKIFELLAIAGIIAGMFFTKRSDFYIDPIPNLIIPTGAIIAYVIINFININPIPLPETEIKIIDKKSNSKSDWDEVLWGFGFSVLIIVFYLFFPLKS
jgi:hypothetical protein